MMPSIDAGRLAGILTRTALLFAFAFASYRAVLLSWSDWEARSRAPSGLRKAESIMPSNPRLHLLNALSIEQVDPLSPEIALEFSATLHHDPRSSDALMAWSVDSELHGDPASAEQLLLRARRIDRLIRPSWALANFYFRQNRPDLFWPPARECLRMIGVTGLATGRFDPTSIYQLSWQLSQDAPLILAKVIPDDRVIRDHYLAFLLGAGRIDAAIDVAALNLPGANAGELLFYLPYIDQLIDRNRMGAAIATWRGLYDQKLLSYPGPNPESRVFLTNGDLLGPPVKAGFDWRFGFPDSVHFTYLPEHIFRFAFNGAEPEAFLLMTQVLPVLPGKFYRFKARYRGDFDPELSGLRWSLKDHRSPLFVNLSGPVSKRGVDSVLVSDFEMPPGVTTANLSLTYHRAPGTPHARGDYDLLGVELSAAPDPSRPGT